jgi:hypothetical protein
MRLHSAVLHACFRAVRFVRVFVRVSKIGHDKAWLSELFAEPTSLGDVNISAAFCV